MYEFEKSLLLLIIFVIQGVRNGLHRDQYESFVLRIQNACQNIVQQSVSKHFFLCKTLLCVIFKASHHVIRSKLRICFSKMAGKICQKTAAKGKGL